jgi:predicted DNA-binding transcriptional regulator AlpA
MASPQNGATKKKLGETEGRRIRQPEAAIYTGYSESTLEKKRLTGEGPPFIKLSDSGRIVYDTRDLDAWLAARRVMSTSARQPTRQRRAATPAAGKEGQPV